jgi:hypothetical protein
MAVRLTLIGLMLLLLQRTPPASRPDAYADADAYVVYAAALRQAKPDRRIIVLGETVTHPRCFPKGAAISDKSWAEAAQHYLAVNKTPKRLARSLDLNKPYLILAPPEAQGLIQKGNWRPFWKRFGEGSGYTRFSAVGFDQSRTKAMLYSDYSCGALCGGGGYKLFTKFGGRWRSTIVNADLCDWTP